ncbi:S-layer homology domain-containing protein [Acidaminobacter hydrogenoformans]|uniref:SLH domain-containing protein n=1 Tax=Acidaminobacter hydrogenoformans DSM 2784 TaxID=1120920 RepID=A0A1G5RZZ8_9FIRM|nr:S-layer homology domain-containing protein [Acidaminobacter hydrogenoformans]SCZ79051.1 hypothetical protein SAMN03080599_01569 [Acidaminobacter hydrogenoformans DSM 2784]
MKRVLSLVLALVLVLGMIPMGFADGHTAGEMLKGYGIIVGDETGDLNEDQNLNRAEMMVVLARMMGKGAEAEAFALPSTFTDLASFGWAVPWVAYAEMNEWTAGVGANMFNPAGNVTAQEAAVFLLKALGYEADVDFNWDNAVEFATAKGLFAGVDTAEKSPILRGDLFTMMVTALNTEVKDGSELLGIKLGYMEVTELEVVSVKALNLVQVEVKFNMPVDEESAEDFENYILTDEDGDDIFTDAEWEEAAFSLQSDEKTVVITMIGALEVDSDYEIDQQDEAILEIDGVKSADEELSIDDYVSDVFEFGDITIPKATKAEVIGNDTIKVYFSEPVVSVSDDDFEVEDGDYIIEDAYLVNNNTEANVVLYSELEEGKITIEVSGMEDFAGFNVVKTVFEIDVVEDNDAPVVTGYTDAKTKEVTLIFNEDIEELFDNDDYDFDYEYFYHTNSNNVVGNAEALADDADFVPFVIDGNELTLDFTDNPLPEGTAYVYVAADAVQDFWENANNKIVTKVEITVDNTAPVLEAIDVDLADNDVDVEITLEFSEDIAYDTIDDDAFMIVDEDGDEVGFDVENYSADTDEIVITLDDPADEVSGEFKITVQDLEDTSNNEIVKVTKTFAVDDLAAPVIEEFVATLYNPGDDDQMIKIDFDEKMATEGAYSVLNIEKYMVYVAGEGFVELSDLDVTPEIKLVDNGEAIEILIASTEDDEDGVNLVAGTDYLQIGRVADEAGNKATTLSGTIDLKSAGNVYVDSFEVTGENTVVITFDDKLTTFKAADLKFYAGTTTDTPLAYSRISTSVNSDNDTVVTVKLVEDIDYNAKLVVANEFVVLKIVDNESENYYGESIAFETGDYMEADDAYAPEIAEFDADEDEDLYVGTAPNEDDAKVLIQYTSDTSITLATITIEFTENIAQDSLSRLAFSVADAKVISVDSDGTNVVTIEIEAESGETFDGDERLVVTQKYAVSDMADNEFKSSTTLRPFVLK